MTRFVYMDESGELGTRTGSSRHFLIAAISIPDPLPLERKIKRLNAQLYNDGWPCDVELKGTTLWSCQAKIQLRERIPVGIRLRRTEIIRDYLTAIHAAGCRIAYSVALKERMTERLLRIDYGIVYNWLSGLLLTRYYEHALRGHDVTLFVDQRNKERHHHRHFDGYIQGRFFELYPDCRQLIIRHETGAVRGLQAVDFVSWWLFDISSIMTGSSAISWTAAMSSGIIGTRDGNRPDCHQQKSPPQGGLLGLAVGRPRETRLISVKTTPTDLPDQGKY